MVKTWFLTHWFWLIFIGLGLVFAHSWLTEHDARLQADAQVKVSEANVAVLQKQVVSNDADIASLKQQMAQSDAEARKQVETLTALVASVRTTPQAAKGIAQMTDDKVQPVAQANGDVVIPQPQVIPLFQELAQGKEDAVNLQACKADLVTQQAITAKTQDSLTAEQGIVKEKDTEIVALKKKPGFWHRVCSTLKQVGIGLVVGDAAGKL